eukprot:CAMPEP_0169441948 /NCGR_PEP_ID=MMETSP1042-20121227/8563_1 /TAXON_ID=464988 /ORGANISM="Hemiselmis andersenii, Strain CCMP1180" /LENGTH=443 /DNA_ID=CAMNT_0009553081 /DNA_START=62 /DNA_END=1390 /DNA_ORIENTATION=-
MSAQPPSSWISVRPNSDFSLSNIPFGIFTPPQPPTSSLLPSPPSPHPRVGTRVGDTVVDLSALSPILASVCDPSVFSQPTLNEFMGLGREKWRGVRRILISLLSEDGSPTLREDAKLRHKALFQADRVTMHMPATIGDYTDFFTSRDHAYNCGCMFRDPSNALYDNFLHLPVGYHGRASSVYVSGTDVVRPFGQVAKVKGVPAQGSVHVPTGSLDFEMELGYFLGGPPTDPGHVMTLEEAESRIFGVVLLNDWSARDVQAWEYVPLGPFTAKNFATSISPWVVTMDALEPFRCDSVSGLPSDPKPLAYLADGSPSHYDINLTVEIRGKGMTSYETVTSTNAKYLFWSFKQQLTHHTVTGCRMNPGDLCGTGTISGKHPSSYGCLLELSWNKTRQVALGSTGESRTFLEDGDTVRIPASQPLQVQAESALGNAPAQSSPPAPAP